MDVSKLDKDYYILMCQNGHENDDDATDAARFYASPFAMYFMLQRDARKEADDLTPKQFNAVCSYLNQEYNVGYDADEYPYLSPRLLNDFFESSSLVYEVASDCEDYGDC